MTFKNRLRKLIAAKVTANLIVKSPRIRSGTRMRIRMLDKALMLNEYHFLEHELINHLKEAERFETVLANGPVKEAYWL